MTEEIVMTRLMSNRHNVSYVASWDVYDGPSDAMRELIRIVGLKSVPTVDDNWWRDVLAGLWRRFCTSMRKNKDNQKRVIDMDWDYGHHFLDLIGPTASVITGEQIKSRGWNRDGSVNDTGELLWGSLSCASHGRVVVVSVTTSNWAKLYLFASRPEEVPRIMTMAEAYDIPRDPLTNRTRRSLAIMEKRYPTPRAFVPMPVPMPEAVIIGRPRYR